MAISRSVLVLMCGCVLIPSQGRTELRNGQKVIRTVPAGYEHWLVTDDCTIARLLVINEPYRKGAEPAMKKRPEMTYETKSAGVIQEVDPEGECVWVEVQPDGPGGWLHNSQLCWHGGNEWRTPINKQLAHITYSRDVGAREIDREACKALYRELKKAWSEFRKSLRGGSFEAEFDAQVGARKSADPNEEPSEFRFYDLD